MTPILFWVAWLLTSTKVLADLNEQDSKFGVIGAWGMYLLVVFTMFLVYGHALLV